MRPDAVGIFIVDLEAACVFGDLARDNPAFLFRLGERLVFCEGAGAFARDAKIHIMDLAVFVAGIGGDRDRAVFDLEVGFCAKEGKAYLASVFLQPCGIVAAFLRLKGAHASAAHLVGFCQDAVFVNLHGVLRIGKGCERGDLPKQIVGKVE